MLNYYYSDTISDFLAKSSETIIGEISLNGRLGHIHTELYAWEYQIKLLKEVLVEYEGHIVFEFSIPRMGKRIDCILIIQNIVFILEFKVGAKDYNNHDYDQVWDYGVDLKNFHKPSHNLTLAPILIATQAKSAPFEIITTSHEDNLINPIRSNSANLKNTIQNVLDFEGNENEIINADDYLTGSYTPTPNIIEFAVRIYNEHDVDNITRKGADEINLTETTSYISESIRYAKENSKKVICFVTGVPGAGKTLVGLKIATEHLDKEKESASVYLSGNKPLVDVLQEALVRDKVERERTEGKKITKKKAREGVKAFIQIIHHYRDAYLRDSKPPYDHVAIFDEAQRAWNKQQTVKFMQQKKGIKDFQYSEPEFLISCLDRHPDWAVVVCLVGGGQEIHTGEAGISEWLSAINHEFPHWETRISPHLYDSEYAAQDAIEELKQKSVVEYDNALHLSVCLRSFKAQSLSKLVKEILDIESNAVNTLSEVSKQYPIVITRDVNKAKMWLKEKARGTERYGMVVSSQAYRLRPFAIDVRAEINHVYWFLNDKDDIRSSYFLEDVATEFQVQGLELDWACLTWDGDLRYIDGEWRTHSFVGNKWQRVLKEERRQYLINAYRVLLTRARKGLVIVIPEGNPEDATRLPEYYDGTFNYLKGIGFEVI